MEASMRENINEDMYLVAVMGKVHSAGIARAMDTKEIL